MTCSFSDNTVISFSTILNWYRPYRQVQLLLPLVEVTRVVHDVTSNQNLGRNMKPARVDYVILSYMPQS